MTWGLRPPRRTALAWMVLGLLATSLPPPTLAQGEDDEPYREQDPRNDASIGWDEAALDDVGKSVDLLEVGLGREDAVGLHLRVRIADLRAETPPTWSPIVTVELNATAPGDGYSYGLAWELHYPAEGPAPTGTQALPSRLCLQHGSRTGSCYAQRVKAWVDWDQSELHADVTKDALMGRAPLEAGPAPPGLPVVRPGTQIGGLELRTWRVLGFFVYTDSWSGPDFTFDAPTANLNLTLARQSARTMNASKAPGVDETALAPATVSVMPGVPSAVALVVENHNAARRLVQVEATTTDTSGRWQADVAPAVQVPGGDRRVVTLLLNASADVRHLESTVVRVVARSLGQDDELGAVELDAVASVPPSPERRTLYFHARSAPARPGFCWGDCGDVQAWMNTLPDDPQADLDEGGFAVPPGFDFERTRFEATFGLDTPLVRDLVLDTKQRARGQVAFVADPPFEAQVRVMLVAGKVLLARQETIQQVASTPLPFGLAVPNRFARIPPTAGQLALVVQVEASTQDGPLLPLTGLRLRPQESRIELPVIPDPEVVLERGDLGVSFLALHWLGSEHDFVNPGRARLFNFTLLNEGHEEVEARVRLDTGLATAGAPAGWGFELRPGAQFRLKSGESVRLGLLVHPPEGAHESDTAWARINATVGDELRPHSQLRFTAITTTTVDFPDESTHFRVDAEDEAKLVGARARDTPAPTPFLALALLLAFHAGRRRRHMV